MIAFRDHTPKAVCGWYRHEHLKTAVGMNAGYEFEPALRWNVCVGLRGADDALVAAVDTGHEWSNSEYQRKFTQSMALHTASLPQKVGTSFAPEIGPDLFCAASRGLVSNHRERPYRGGRQKHWIKMAALFTEGVQIRRGLEEWPSARTGARR
jgi:hypothetical protein